MPSGIRKPVWVVVIILLLAGATYLYSWYYPRVFSRVFGFAMPAHVGPVGCVPNDYPGPAGLPDHHDAPYAPAASHNTQHLEWIGECVDEEVGPRQPDNFNDGVFILPRQPRGGHRILPGDVLDVIVIVSTAFFSHPNKYPTPLPLSVWLDWNLNASFDGNEREVAVLLPVPFFVGFLPPVPAERARLSFPVTVPANYAGASFPPIRARLSFNQRGQAQRLLVAGGVEEWGEVEDYEFPLNYQAMIPDFCPGPEEGIMVGLYFDEERRVIKTAEYDPQDCDLEYPAELVDEAREFYVETFEKSGGN